MLTFIKKIIKFGIRRALVRALIILLLNIKKYFYYFLSDNNAEFSFKSTFQPTQFVGKGKISINKTARIGVWPSPTLLSDYAYLEARRESAKITIGERTFINNKATIIADKTSIVIGSDCLIGQNVNIYDSDFHGIEVENRTNGNYECYPVNIGNNVFLGGNVTVLKGVTIGKGAVVASGSIVIRDVEPFSVVAGTPAKKIKSIQSLAAQSLI